MKTACLIASSLIASASAFAPRVEFVETEATDKAMELTGMDVMGRTIRVDYANDRRNGGEWKLLLDMMIDSCVT